MPGKVSSVAVKKGDAVKAGQRLLSIEAMKMETAVYSPREAKVADVAVKAGTTVSAGDLLVVLEGPRRRPSCGRARRSRRSRRRRRGDDDQEEMTARRWNANAFNLARLRRDLKPFKLHWFPACGARTITRRSCAGAACCSRRPSC
jgi:pyruvate/2-oxoglutarate dehydrogenase complex dihydrolipoamide acyltransferase (E2) component